MKGITASNIRGKGWWNSLTPAQKEAHKEKIKRGQALKQKLLGTRWNPYREKDLAMQSEVDEVDSSEAIAVLQRAISKGGKK